MPATNPSRKVTKKPAKAAKRTRKSSTPKGIELAPEMRHEMIEQAAYLRAERRGFQGGDPVSDWLLSEQEVDGTLAKGAH